jgi:hypothetical protein
VHPVPAALPLPLEWIRLLVFSKLPPHIPELVSMATVVAGAG